MRGPLALVLLAILALAAFAWATLARVPEEGALYAWDPASGELEVPERGVALYPRWRWSRLAGQELEARVSAPAGAGGTVEARLRWRPAAGSYRLAPAPEPAAGFAARAGEAIGGALAALPVGCLVDGGKAPEDCPPDPGLAVAEAAGAAIGIAPDRLRVALAPDAEAVRAHLLAAIAADLPRTGRKVLVLGLDGLDWDLVLPWARQGRMPNLGRLLATGTWGTLETLVPTLSPLIWTTVATGVSPDRHGILDFVEKDPARGVMVPVTGRSRRVPAIWNLASALGREVLVVGWWGTWPVERVRGAMVSDRLYYTLTQGLTREVLREDLPALVYPEERTAELVELRDRAVAETDWRAVRYFMRVPEERFAAAVASERGMEDPVDGFRRMLAATRTYLGAGLALAAGRPELAMVYLEGTDTIGHLLAPYVEPPTLEDADPQESAVLVAAVPRYFEVVDRWLGRYLESYPLSEYTWLVISDHGFKWGEGRPRGVSGTAGPTAPLWHELDAVFLAAGPGVERRGRVTEPASVYDLAPTVAALLGLPPDSGWRGSPLPGCPPATLAPIDYLPLVPPESYRQEGGGVAPVDPEYLAKLEALGYLGGGRSAGGTVTAPEEGGSAVAAAPPAPAPAAPPVAAPGDPTTTRGELNNLAVLMIQEKRYEEAEELLRRAIAQSPDYPSPHYNLRRIYMETGRYDDADRELWRAVEKGLRDTERSIDKAAADYEDLGLVGRAATVLERAIESYPGHEPFWVHLMVVRIRLEECAAGSEVGREAAARFPESAPVHAFYGLSAACAGDVAAARAALERSLALNPEQPTLRRTLADLGEG